MPIVTFDQVKAHLQMDHDLDDAKIEEITQEASDTMLDYLKKPAGYWQDTAGEPAGVPGSVKAATLKIAASLYENRDGSGTHALSQDVKDMVHRHRDPAFA